MQMPGFNRTVLDLAEALAAGRTSSRELVEAALARVAAPDGEGARTFVAVYADRNGRRRRPGPMTQGGLCRLPARRTSGLGKGPVRCRRRTDPRRVEGARRLATGRS